MLNNYWEDERLKSLIIGILKVFSCPSRYIKLLSLSQLLEGNLPLKILEKKVKGSLFFRGFTSLRVDNLDLSTQDHLLRDQL